MAQEDFGANFLRGAQVGNMRAMQLERAQELASQDALRRIQERNLAQEIDQRAQIFQKAQAEDAQDKADLAGFASLYHEQVSQKVNSAQMENDAQAGGSGEPVDASSIANETLQTMLPALAMKNPRAASLVTKALTPVMRQQTQENVAQTRAGASTQNAQTRATTQLSIADKGAALKDAQSKLALAKTSAIESGGTMSGAPDATEKQANALARARQAVSAAYDSEDESAIKEAEQHLTDLKQAQARQHPDKQAAMESQMLLGNQREAYKAWLADPTNDSLKKEYQRLTEEVKAVGSGSKTAPAAAAGDDELVPIISPDGKRGKIPRKNYEKALKSGYKPVK